MINPLQTQIIITYHVINWLPLTYYVRCRFVLSYCSPTIHKFTRKRNHLSIRCHISIVFRVRVTKICWWCCCCVKTERSPREREREPNRAVQSCCCDNCRKWEGTFLDTAGYSHHCRQVFSLPTLTVSVRFVLFFLPPFQFNSRPQ
jgi:hypothetical protein